MSTFYLLMSNSAQIKKNENENMKMMNSLEETYYFIKKHPLNEIRLQKLIININSLRWHRGLIPLTMMTTTFRGHRT